MRNYILFIVSSILVTVILAVGVIYFFSDKPGNENESLATEGEVSLSSEQKASLDTVTNNLGDVIGTWGVKEEALPEYDLDKIFERIRDGIIDNKVFDSPQSKYEENKKLFSVLGDYSIFKSSLFNEYDNTSYRVVNESIEKCSKGYNKTLVGNDLFLCDTKLVITQEKTVYEPKNDENGWTGYYDQMKSSYETNLVISFVWEDNTWRVFSVKSNDVNEGFIMKMSERIEDNTELEKQLEVKTYYADIINDVNNGLYDNNSTNDDIIGD